MPGSTEPKSARSGKESLSSAPRPPTVPTPTETREKQGDEEVQHEICIPLPPDTPRIAVDFQHLLTGVRFVTNFANYMM